MKKNILLVVKSCYVVYSWFAGYIKKLCTRVGISLNLKKDNILSLSFLFVFCLLLLKFLNGGNLLSTLGGFVIGGLLFYFLDNRVVYSNNFIVRSFQLFLVNFVVIIISIICVVSISEYFLNIVECSPSGDSSNDSKGTKDSKDLLKLEETNNKDKGKYTISYHSAIENPVGFNYFMYGLTEYRRTGNWPNLAQMQKNVMSESKVSEWASKTMENKSDSVVSQMCKEAIEKSKN